VLAEEHKVANWGKDMFLATNSLTSFFSSHWCYKPDFVNICKSLRDLPMETAIQDLKKYYIKEKLQCQNIYNESMGNHHSSMFQELFDKFLNISPGTGLA